MGSSGKRAAGPDARRFGQNLRAARKARRWTLEALGSRVRPYPLHNSRVSLIERGEVRVSLDDAAALARAVGVDLCELAFGKGGRRAE